MEAMLNMNPVNGSIPSGIGRPIFYTDLFLINYTSESYDLTITIDLPLKYDVKNVKYLAAYITNYEEHEGQWISEALDTFPYGTVTKDFQNNLLIMNVV